MNTIFGIVLFVVGTLGAFVAATAAIAYLRTLSVYMGMKKLYRASFSTGMIAIAVLVSVLIGQMLTPVRAVGAVDTSSEVISAGDSTETLEGGRSVEDAAETMPKDEVEPIEVAETENAQAPEVTNEVEPTTGAETTMGSSAVSQPSTTPRNALVPSFSVWSNVYKGKEYAYVEVENGVPYVYAPNYRGSFWYNLNNISAGRESSNIVVMANAGVFDMTTLQPIGTTIQNGKIVSSGEATKSKQTLVVDEDGNVGYINSGVVGISSSYIDVLTGKKVSGKKIVSAVTAFVPILINGKKATAYENQATGYRARSVFCVRGKGSYTLIANKGEGEDGGGWNFDDMVTVSQRRGCVFSFNLDGGGSTSLAWRTSVYSGFSAYVATERNDPTFIVFTSDNLAPSGK